MISTMSTGSTNMNELYAMLPPEARCELEKYEHSMVVPQGTALIEHSVLPDSLVILNSGTVRVSVPCRERCATLTTAQAGKVFGMRAAISGELPEIDVTCMEPCRVTYVPRDTFLGVLRARPQIYFAVAKVLSGDLQIADRILRSSTRRCSPASRTPLEKTN
jgi:CRP-like cAMP-binding protein